MFLLSMKCENAFESPFEFKIKNFVFSGGEVQIRIENINDFISLLKSKGVEKTELLKFSVQANIYTSNHFMSTIMALSALKTALKDWLVFINLTLPYMPYARQDRVCYAGEAFALETAALMFAKLNLCNSVTFWDVHSKVAIEIFEENNIECKNITAAEIIGKFLKGSNEIPITNITSSPSGLNYEDPWGWFFTREKNADKIREKLQSYDVVIAPDKGALNRAKEVAETLSKTFVVAEKLRDPNNGAILETIVHADNLQNKKVIIVDDICDGGRTFTELAKVLKNKNVKDVGLYVTHGIFSKGFTGVFNDLITDIFTANSFLMKNT